MPARLKECLDWDSPNKPGEMWEYADFFKSEGIALHAFWAYTVNKGDDKLAAIARRPDKLRAALEKRGVRPRSSSCLFLSGGDTRAALIGALKSLAGENINIECADWLADRGRFIAIIWVRKEDLKKAAGLLKAR
jgi:hypothetical protein